jgi:hypothetical protein
MKIWLVSFVSESPIGLDATGVFQDGGQTRLELCKPRPILHLNFQATRRLIPNHRFEFKV